MAAAWTAGARGFSAANVSSLSTSGFTIAGVGTFLRALAFSGAATPANVSGIAWDAAGVNEALAVCDAAISFNTSFRASTWDKTGPTAATTKVVTATWAANQDETMVIADAYSGIDQSTPKRSLPTPTQGTSAAPSISVTSVAGDLVVGSVAEGMSSANITTITSATLSIREKVEGADIGNFEGCAQGDVTAVGSSTTASFTLNTISLTPTWVMFGAALIPAASGPIIDTQPVSQTVLRGNTANFTISATTSGGALSYQWKQNGGNVGTNSSSYTTASTVSADNLSTITCDVTDSNGTTTSATAILYVITTATIAWISA